VENQRLSEPARSRVVLALAVDWRLTVEGRVAATGIVHILDVLEEAHAIRGVGSAAVPIEQFALRRDTPAMRAFRMSLETCQMPTSRPSTSADSAADAWGPVARVRPARPSELDDHHAVLIRVRRLSLRHPGLLPN